MKKISTFILVLFSITLIAKEVPRDVAVKAATFYYKERCIAFGNPLTTEPTVKSVYVEKSGNIALYYVVNFEPKGFVVIAADDASVPVLGYSVDQYLDKNNASPSLLDWFTIYEESLKAVIKAGASPTPEAKAEWSRITSPEAVVGNAKFGVPMVGPLLSTTWNQDQYYNEQVPFDSMSVNGYDYHVPNGCVALSMSQVMFYNRHPKMGNGSKTYNESNSYGDGGIDEYGILSANFGATTYNWDAMTDVVTNYNFSVAQLIYHAGVAVSMDYAVEGSGTQTAAAVLGFKQYFRYTSNLTYKDKTQYNETTWKALFKTQLDGRHPMVNSGRAADGSGGHAFNCDGYDDQDYFHFNFGWGGSGNGWFLLTNLNPISNDFNTGQQAVINIYPDITPVACPTNVVLTARNGSLEDGSRSANYADNLDCQWLIAPDEGTSITVSFSRIATELGADSIVFYAGETTASPVVASFSGTTLPGTFTIDNPKALVRFITNGSVNNDGWLFNYTSTVVGSYCSSVKVYTTATGTVTDGSDVNKYHNNSYCKWFIQPSGAANITLTFTEFDLSVDDQLYVLNRVNSTNPSLISILTGSTMPAAIYCPSGRLGLTFQADNNNIANGFGATWTSSTSGINEISGVENIMLFPNPVTSQLNIEMALENNFQGTVNILDISGKVVYTSEINTGSGTFTHTADVSGLSKGFYLVNFVSNSGERIAMKFSKN